LCFENQHSLAGTQWYCVIPGALSVLWFYIAFIVAADCVLVFTSRILVNILTAKARTCVQTQAVTCSKCNFLVKGNWQKKLVVKCWWNCNILLATSVAQTPKAQKDTNDLIVIFALSATARIKTARKTLVKLSLDVLSRPHLKRDGPSFSYLRLNWTTELLNLNGVKIIVVTSLKGVFFQLRSFQLKKTQVQRLLETVNCKKRRYFWLKKTIFNIILFLPIWSHACAALLLLAIVVTRGWGSQLQGGGVAKTCGNIGSTSCLFTIISKPKRQPPTPPSPLKKIHSHIFSMRYSITVNHSPK